MPSTAASFRRPARRSLRVHALLIGVVVLATLQAGMLLSIGARLFSEEENRISQHFRHLEGTLEDQEQFFRGWRMRKPAGPAMVAPGAFVQAFLDYYGESRSSSPLAPPQCLLMEGHACLLGAGGVDEHGLDLGAPFFEKLSLFGRHGELLIGEASDAYSGGAGWRAGPGGIAFRMRSEHGWQAVYHVGWSQMLQHPGGLLLGSVAVALLLAAVGGCLVRGYRRSVVDPPRQGHARLLECEAEQVLEQARLAADQANRAKSQFLATMSHEIRTPLYGVLGSLELLGLTPLDGRQRAHLQTIERSSSNLMQLIGDILDFSEAETGQLRLEPGDFDPVRLTEDIVESHVPAATHKGLQLYACIAGRVPHAVTGDATRIRQILSNLISNAVKFTWSGRVVVRLVAESVDGADWLHWQVSDSGIGIANEHHGRLFEPFFQVNPGNDATRGTGLGLSLCARLVALMEGRMRVVSEVGLGSSFSVGLPLPHAELVVTDPPQSPVRVGLPVRVRGDVRELVQSTCERLKQRGIQAAVVSGEDASVPVPGTLLLDILLEGTVLPWDGPHVVACAHGGPLPCRVEGCWQVGLHRFDAIVAALCTAADTPVRGYPDSGPSGLRQFGLHVLVAEDNPINQRILREQLEQLGCHPVMAGNGEEALEHWKRRGFSLIVTDLNMPGLDGYGLVRALRESGARVPIYGATANADPAELQRCREAGMEGIMVKPITLLALRRVLAGVAGERDPGNALVRDPPLQVPAGMQLLFVTTMREDLDSLKQALDNLDTPSIIQVVHRIRGALVLVGARALVEAGEIIEQQLAHGYIGELVHRSIAQFMERVHAQLDSLAVASPPHSPFPSTGPSHDHPNTDR
jgi:two-component system capsular synthesis sensor histidine kinase RcsC